jgi:hypothetical protein
VKTNPLNLPRCGIFQAGEIKTAEIPWQTGATGPHPGSEDKLNLSGSACFLCGVPLAPKHGAKNEDTGEDVFAQWMQRRFDLAHLPVTLSDDSIRMYSEVLIPCCAECNGTYLSRAEDRIKNALTEGGFSRLTKLRKADIFLWCAKIYYALVHLEVKPRHPKTKAPLAPTLPAYRLEDLRFLLRLLQGLRKRVFIFGPAEPPFSVLLFRLHTGRDRGAYFHIRLCTVIPAIALELGGVGIICTFDDFSQIEAWYKQEYTQALSSKTLHPDQFWELAGRAFYHSYVTPLAISMACVEGAKDVHLDLLVRPDRGPKFNPEEEAQWIQQVTKAPKGFFWNAQTGEQRTVLKTLENKFHEIPFADISGEEKPEG